MLHVIGVGSPQGDDQVGWRLVQEFAETHRTDLSVCAVSSPIDILGKRDGCDTVIVVDACDAGEAPGSVLEAGTE
jgi:hydrogenase maturation protease